MLYCGIYLLVGQMCLNGLPRLLSVCRSQKLLQVVSEQPDKLPRTVLLRNQLSGQFLVGGFECLEFTLLLLTELLQTGQLFLKPGEIRVGRGATLPLS